MLTSKDFLNPFYALFFLTGPVLFCYALVWFVQTQMFLINAETLEAKVMYSFDSNDEELGRTTVEFMLKQEKEQRRLTTVSHYSKGDRVQLLRDETSDEVRIRSFVELYYENIACFLVAVVVSFPWWFMGYFWFREKFFYS